MAEEKKDSGSKATLKQRRAFKAYLESGGNKSWKDIMREAGYSESYARIPQKVTESEGWQELLDTVDDDAVLRNLQNIATEKQNSTAVSAARLIFELKGRFPKQGQGKGNAYISAMEELVTSPEEEQKKVSGDSQEGESA